MGEGVADSVNASIFVEPQIRDRLPKIDHLHWEVLVRRETEEEAQVLALRTEAMEKKAGSNRTVKEPDREIGPAETRERLIVIR